MDQSFHAWSQEFLSDPSFADSSTVLMCELDWNDITHELQADGGRIFVKLSSADISVICSVGNPIRQYDVERNAIFLPYWILDRLNILGYGDEINAEFFLRDAFSEATKIILRPHISRFYDVEDVKGDLEMALTRVGVIEKGTTVMLPLSQLGGELLAFDIMNTEPASVVLCEGDEVAIEFEPALDIPPTDHFEEAKEEEVKEEPAPTYRNPWRHKDFAPPYSRND